MGVLIRVNESNMNVPKRMQSDCHWKLCARNMKMTAASKKPTDTALIPESECLIRPIFFKSDQNGTMNNMSINPGKLMPKTAMMLPPICPKKP